MMQLIIAYVATALVFAVVDIIWISQVARPYIFSKIESLIGLNYTAAVLFYLFYIAGIIIFAINPASYYTGPIAYYVVFISAFLFGFFCYMTYDLTNMATLKDWAWSMVFADVAWGSFVTAISATLGLYITRLFIA